MKDRTRIEELMEILFRSEAKARIYLFLALKKEALAEEIAKGTNLHPSTVREALADMCRSEHLTKTKGEGKGAGRIPWKYRIVPLRRILRGYMNEIESLFFASDFSSGKLGQSKIACDFLRKQKRAEG